MARTFAKIAAFAFVVVVLISVLLSFFAGGDANDDVQSQVDTPLVESAEEVTSTSEVTRGSTMIIGQRDTTVSACEAAVESVVVAYQAETDTSELHPAVFEGCYSSKELDAALESQEAYRVRWTGYNLSNSCFEGGESISSMPLCQSYLGILKEHPSDYPVPVIPELSCVLYETWKDAQNSYGALSETNKALLDSDSDGVACEELLLN